MDGWAESGIGARGCSLMKIIDRFDRDDDETNVVVVLTTVGPVIVGLETRNRALA